MKVGNVYKLKEQCLGNQPGAIGVVFNVYDGGFQVIFENGEYDGFSTRDDDGRDGVTEAGLFLDFIGVSSKVSWYQFRNVIVLCEDFRNGVFDPVFKNRDFEHGIMA